MTSDSLWPNAEERLLLQSALLNGPAAVAAFEEWRGRFGDRSEFRWGVLRLLPLVYQNLHAHGVRDPLMGRMRGMYRKTFCETHQLFHHTAPVVRELVSHGLPVLLLKGAPLVLSYYRNHAVRPMADLDLWVPRDRVHAAIQIMMEAGYVCTESYDADALHYRHAVNFIHPSGGDIDLHWRMLYETRDPALDEMIWLTGEPLEFLGVPVRQPDPTAMLLTVIMHGVRWNEETPIRWIPDALTILRTRGPAIQWQRLVSTARKYRLSSRLGRGLAYLVETFEAPVPADVLEQLLRRRSLLELVENTVLLSDGWWYARSVLGTQWVAFTEYCRLAPSGGALAFLNGYSHFLRYRMGLDGRSEIVPFILRGVVRRLHDESVGQEA
jgi:hypothetical protein